MAEPETLTISGAKYRVEEVTNDGWCFYRTFLRAAGIEETIEPIQRFAAAVSDAFLQDAAEKEAFRMYLIAEAYPSQRPYNKEPPVEGEYVQKNGGVRVEAVTTPEEYAKMMPELREPGSVAPAVWPDAQFHCRSLGAYIPFTVHKLDGSAPTVCPTGQVPVIHLLLREGEVGSGHYDLLVPEGKPSNYMPSREIAMVQRAISTGNFTAQAADDEYAALAADLLLEASAKLSARELVKGAPVRHTPPVAKPVYKAPPAAVPVLPPPPAAAPVLPPPPAAVPVLPPPPAAAPVLPPPPAAAPVLPPPPAAAPVLPPPPAAARIAGPELPTRAQLRTLRDAALNPLHDQITAAAAAARQAATDATQAATAATASEKAIVAALKDISAGAAILGTVRQEAKAARDQADAAQTAAREAEESVSSINTELDATDAAIRTATEAGAIAAALTAINRSQASLTATITSTEAARDKTNAATAAAVAAKNQVESQQASATAMRTAVDRLAQTKVEAAAAAARAHAHAAATTAALERARAAAAAVAAASAVADIPDVSEGLVAHVAIVTKAKADSNAAAAAITAAKAVADAALVKATAENDAAKAAAATAQAASVSAAAATDQSAADATLTTVLTEEKKAGAAAEAAAVAALDAGRARATTEQEQRRASDAKRLADIAAKKIANAGSAKAALKNAEEEAKAAKAALDAAAAAGTPAAAAAARTRHAAAVSALKAAASAHAAVTSGVDRDPLPAWVPPDYFSLADIPSACDSVGFITPDCVPKAIYDEIMVADTFAREGRLDKRKDPLKDKYLALASDAPSSERDARIARAFPDAQIQVRTSDDTIEVLPVVNPYRALGYREDTTFNWANPAGTFSSHDPDGALHGANMKVLKALAPHEMIADRPMAISLLESLWYCGTNPTLSNDPRCFPARILGELREWKANKDAMANKDELVKRMMEPTEWSTMRGWVKQLLALSKGVKVVPPRPRPMPTPAAAAAAAVTTQPAVAPPAQPPTVPTPAPLPRLRLTGGVPIVPLGTRFPAILPRPLVI